MTPEQEKIIQQLETVVNEGVVEATHDLRQAIERDTMEDEESEDMSITQS